MQRKGNVLTRGMLDTIKALVGFLWVMLLIGCCEDALEIHEKIYTIDPRH